MIESAADEIREKAQFVKSLLCKHEDLGLDLQQAHRRPDLVAVTLALGRLM